MNKKLKSLFIILISIIVLVSIVLTTYYTSFYPKTSVSPITKEVTFNKTTILKKFMPKNFDISLNKLELDASADFTEEELTDLFILSLQETPEIKDSITGIKVDIDNNKMYVYAHLTYYNIPLEAKLIFNCYSENGKAIFHYENGKIGFINLSKDALFKNAINNSLVTFDKENGDVILSLDEMKNLEITDISFIENGINIKFKTSINFWE